MANALELLFRKKKPVVEVADEKERLKEAERLGIKRVIIPQNNKKLLKDDYKLDIIGVRNINDALHAIGI